ncbi:uncharacterized protein JN550_009680 [Neoarthrinium moseri]|uniref:uncharacterized protein n=1 Tax=Neoarthrinium moseri TaxID=1658444 RepID=UPI001FDCC3BD|nr:uncharacterized protein JN550_009680 [Neoarthrinium moseri]KAI1863360.1 hypothetical protein JN550_009680 [Neoarthrinium moseri]
MAGTPSAVSPTIRRTQSSKAAKTEENVKEKTTVSEENRQLLSQLQLSQFFWGEIPHDCLNGLLHLQAEVVYADDLGFQGSEDSPSRKKSSTALSPAFLENQSCPKRIKLHGEMSPRPDNRLVDDLLKKISEQQSSTTTSKDSGLPQRAAGGRLNLPMSQALSSFSNSMPPTPAVENFGESAPSIRPASSNAKEAHSSDDEVARLQLELALAQSKISQLEGSSQILQTRPMPFDAKLTNVPSRFPGAAILQSGNGQPTGNNWPSYDDSRSDTSDALSATGFNQARNIWGGKPVTAPGSGLMTNAPEPPSHANVWTGRGGPQGFGTDHSGPWNSGPGIDTYRGNNRIPADYDMTIRGPNTRRSGRFDNRFGNPAFNSQASFGTANHPQYGQSQYNGASNDQNAAANGQFPMGPGPGPYANGSGAPIGTPLSPLATEFTSTNGPWKSEHVASEGPTYLPTTEPLNYRRLLDRNVNCNWKYIVDKIVCNNDQQASIFLQQKLKVGTPDQKYEIVDAIILQAHPLMVNRFGNFLVQRCFEHGTPEQVIKIAEAIRGNTLSLSMDPFGCHVVQKAFDSVPEDYKAVMVHELLRRIPETVIHRYACHVWQKLFELRWSESPPQIMKYVNEALRGMWHEVALGETGSLVVQNIFENCLEEDKRPCIEEVLANIDIVAHGQFGNWCIQHICEHGAPADRSRAIDHVIRFAAEYSMDQYASKVVKKCLKIGGGEFLTRYLDRVCEGRVDRPRIPLIDIASDQYGNYLIQWILTQANPQHREVVAAHIRKHMVSLRGSKFGSRVGMLCTNPAVATRPGPGITNMGRVPGPRYGRPYQ